MDMNVRVKKGGLSRLPGRNKLDEQNKFKTENIVRAICKSRNAIEKSKINKITIDGVDYHNISYFQISKLTGKLTILLKFLNLTNRGNQNVSQLP